jgi:hypothetical protein
MSRIIASDPLPPIAPAPTDDVSVSGAAAPLRSSTDRTTTPMVLGCRNATTLATRLVLAAIVG